MQGEFLVSLLHCRRRIRWGGAAAVRGARVISPPNPRLPPCEDFKLQGPGTAPPSWPHNSPPSWGASRKLARGHPATTPLGARDFFLSFFPSFLPSFFLSFFVPRFSPAISSAPLADIIDTATRSWVPFPFEREKERERERVSERKKNYSRQ